MKTPFILILGLIIGLIACDKDDSVDTEDPIIDYRDAITGDHPGIRGIHPTNYTP